MTTDRFIRLAAIAIVVVLGFLPIVNWIPGGHEAPGYGGQLGDWIRDGVLILGVGVLFAIASRRVGALWRPGCLDGITNRATNAPALTATLLGLTALALYSVVAHQVLSAKPLLIDEIIQVWQARVLATGHLSVPVPEFPEFTSAMHLVDHEGRRFGQFPVGGPAMLALGSLAGAEWLVGPVFGAVSVVLVWFLLRRVAGSAGVALGGTLLFMAAPFAMFMAGSHMNHVTVLTWLLVAMLGLARATTGGGITAGFITGLGLGIAATIRPVDALAFALPAGLWLAHQAWRTRKVGPFLASGVGVALPVSLLLAANAATTGDPLLFAYTVMWGSAHDLGFHATPWGEVHSPLAGLELINLYFLRLQLYFLESPFPGLLPAALALLFGSGLRAFDRYLLVSGGLLVGLYFAYWHDGFFLGPRFVYPLLPMLVLWTARSQAAVKRATAAGVGYRVWCFAALAAFPLAVQQVVVIRAAQYASGLQTMRFDADAAARAQGIRDALVLVRESWGAEVMVRMWAAGVSRGESEQLYRRIDTCLLDQALGAIEAEGLKGEDALGRLRPLLVDSARVRSSTLSPDFTERMLPGAQYPPACLERLRQDAEGFTLFAPFLLAGADGNRYLRDLHGRRSWPGWSGDPAKVFVLKPSGSRVGAPPEFLPVTGLRSPRDGAATPPAGTAPGVSDSASGPPGPPLR